MTPLQGRTYVACWVSGKLFSMIGVATLKSWRFCKREENRRERYKTKQKTREVRRSGLLGGRGVGSHEGNAYSRLHDEWYNMPDYSVGQIII